MWEGYLHVLRINIQRQLCALGECWSRQTVAKGNIVRIVVLIADVGILELAAIEGSLQHPAMFGVNLYVAIGVVATYLDVAIRLLHENHSLSHVGKALGVNACVYSTGINLRVGSAGGIDDGIVVIACAIGVSSLVDASRVAKWIVAVAAEDNGLRVIVQDRVQHLHSPGGTLKFAPRAIASPAGSDMCEDEDGLARSICDGLLKVALQGVHYRAGIGCCAIADVIIVVSAAALADGDEGIALDEDILVEWIAAVPVETLEAALVV